MKSKTKKTNHSKAEFYFDDCPICRAMKKAEIKGENLSMDELKQAFDEAKKHGAVVGESLN